MTSLRSAMESFLDGWREDVAPAWRDLLEGVEPAFADVDLSLSIEPDETIFPGRKGRPPEGAAADSHVFRALDGIVPDEASVVVVGQDPYPKVHQATGRAFEQGDLSEWASAGRALTPSLRRIFQQAAEARTGDARYTRPAGGWGRLKEDVESGAFRASSVGEEFDRWQSQGVLFLNTGLTLTRYVQGGHPHQFRGHIPLWRPVVGALCARLARRADRPTVFLAWGLPARQFLAACGVLRSARRPTAVAAEAPNADVIDRDHPAVSSFLDGENVFLAANRLLEEKGGRPIDW